MHLKRIITLISTVIFFTLISSLAFLSISCISVQKKDVSDTNFHPEILAHRGYSDKYKESTMPAFEQAIKAGFTGLEFDIHQTRDQEIIILHDSSVDRTTNGSGEVKDLSLEEIKKLNIDKNTKIPTLNEIITLAKNNNSQSIWPEIKNSSKYPYIIENTYSIIHDNDYENHTTIQSFSIDDLNAMYKLSKKIKLLKLYAYQLTYNFSELPNNITYVGLPIGVGLSMPWLIRDAHQHGFKVIFWREAEFLETENITSCLTKYGADGFMINKPLLLHAN